MTKPEAIAEAIERVDATGLTTLVLRRGEFYRVFPNSGPTPVGWKVAEMVSKGNIHAYRAVSRN